MNTVKNKSDEFSILCAIGALSVITIHVTSNYGEFNNTSLSYLFFGIINKVCNYAVPLFIFLSIALLIKNSIEKGRLNVLEFYKKRFMKTVPIFLVYVIIYYLFLKLINVQLISFSANPIKFITSYIFQGSIYYHLYFMPIIFQLYLFFPFISILVKQIRKIKIKLSVISTFILTLLVLITLQFIFSQIHKYYIWPYFQNPAIILFNYTLPIGLGVWVGINYENMRNSNIIKIISIIVSIISGYYLIRYSLFPKIILSSLIFPIYTAFTSLTLLYLAEFILNIVMY